MLQTRIALFYTSSATAGAFSGLLAFAIAKMDGIGGIAGWRYIFMLGERTLPRSSRSPSSRSPPEGIATVVIGCAIPFLLVDSADRSKWLDDDEKRYIKLAVQLQDGGAAQQARARGVDWTTLRQVLGEWHVYFFSMMYWSASIPNTGEYECGA
jgi:hypothetical protein